MTKKSFIARSLVEKSTVETGISAVSTIAITTKKQSQIAKSIMLLSRLELVNG